jgi:hypothetical protein
MPAPSKNTAPLGLKLSGAVLCGGALAAIYLLSPALAVWTIVTIVLVLWARVDATPRWRPPKDQDTP